MSYYLFKNAEGKVWRGECSGSCPYEEEWSVLQMRATHKIGGEYCRGLDVSDHHADLGPLTYSFWKDYQMFLCAMFEYARPAILEPLFSDPAHYRPTIPMASFTLKAGPAATQHAIWQVLRQVAIRTEQVVACVKEYTDSVGVNQAGRARTELALSLWHKHLNLGEPQAENFNNISLRNWLSRFNDVVHQRHEKLYYTDRYSSAVFRR